MECVQFKAVLSMKERRQAQMRIKNVLLIFVKGVYKEISGLQKYKKKIAAKNYKKKSYQGAGLSSSFFSSPGGIEGTSRLIDRKSVV